MDSPYHGGYAFLFLQAEGIAKVLVVGERVVSPLIHTPPRVRTPEEPAVSGDVAIQIEGRRQVRELETVVEVERRRDLRTDVEPLAALVPIAYQCAPVGAARPRVQVDTRGKLVAQTVVECGVGLLLVEARADFENYTREPTLLCKMSNHSP